MMFLEDERRRNARVLGFVTLVALSAASMTLLLISVQRSFFFDQANWAVFALFGTLLALGETRPSFTMRFGDNGEVSPGWTFAFALTLYGMPLGALLIMCLANASVDLGRRNPARMVVYNVSQIALAISCGALVLHLFGLRGSMTDLDVIPIRWGVGILVAAGTVLAVNGVLTAIVIGLHTGSGFIDTIRTGLALSVTADGALLSLAPVFVIAVDYSFVLVPLLATTSYIVIRSARSSLQRAHDANHDPLTGLLNRRALDERLATSLNAFGLERHAVVLVMDFDGFKDINDTLGHAVGDSLLIAFGERLSECLPPSAAAARLGGDEFAVLIPGRLSDTTIDTSIRELHEALTKPYEIDGFPLSTAVSIGVAIAPDDGQTPSDLLASADLAMYHAKQAQSGIARHRTSSSRASSAGRIDLLAELAEAIANDRLIVHYQPQFDLRDGRVDAVEALVRWDHPRHGHIRPDEFVGLAEQTDLIDSLTEAVLRRSMREVLRFAPDGLVLAVNISAPSLHDRKFASMVLDCLADTGFPADRLELEITERAFATDTERMTLTLSRLRALGVQIAIDDFGTGYSSFASLRSIDADRLKIDKQFVQRIDDGPEDLLVLETIVHLAHGLGMNVVAEGVEHLGARDELRRMGCDHAQGYALARPLSFDEVSLRIPRWMQPTGDPGRAAGEPAADRLATVVHHPSAGNVPKEALA